MSKRILKFIGNPWVTLAVLVMALANTPVAAQVHGCTLEAATDRTGEAIVDLDWDFGHSSCILVAPGTTVRWVVAGSWSLHPLTGGVTPVPDSSNPISLADIEGDVASVTFDSPGAYPYFCETHTTTMTGVVYVATPPPNSCNVNSFSNVIEGGTGLYEACDQLVIGPDFLAEDSADVSLNAGMQIDIVPELLIEQGATLTLEVCGQSLCEVSEDPMPNGCHSCVDQICDVDSGCCNLAFDQGCVDKVDSVCGLVCEEANPPCPCSGLPQWDSYLESGDWNECKTGPVGGWTDLFRLMNTTTSRRAASGLLKSDGLYRCASHSASGFREEVVPITSEEEAACEAELQAAADKFGTICTEW